MLRRSCDSGGGGVVLLGGNAGLGLVAVVLLELADFGGGESLVASQQAVAAEGPSSAVAEKPANEE